MFFRKQRQRTEFLFTPLMACMGVLITGRIGSGKTTILRWIVEQLAKQGVKLAIACVKPDEAQAFQRILPDAVLMSTQRWNPFQEYMSFGLGSNFAKLLEDLSDVLMRADSQKQEAFWKVGSALVLLMACELAYLVNGSGATITDVLNIINSVPTTPDAAANSSLNQTTLGQFINRLAEKDKDRAKTYWDFFGVRVHSVGDRAAGAWVSQAINALHLLTGGPVAALLSGEPTITTDEILTRHTIWDVDTLSFGQGGIAYQLLCSWVCMEAVLRRKGNFGYWGLVRDEYPQLSFAQRDIQAVSVGRSMKFCSLAAYQSQPTLEAALGGGIEAQTEAKALFGLYVHRIFCNQTCQYSAEMQSMAIGQHKEMFFGLASQKSSQQPSWYDLLGVGAAPTLSMSQNWHYSVPPTKFMSLKTGGPEHGFIVEAIHHDGERHQPISVSQR